MATPARLVLLLVVLAPMIVVAPGVAGAPEARPSLRAVAGSGSSAPEPAGGVRIAVANVREGSLVAYAGDWRGDTDRTAFARRLLARPGRAPDVVLLQEVLGTAGRIADDLNRLQRSQGSSQRYAVATGTRRGRDSGTCDGRRSGGFSVLRSSAVLVNTTTVTRVAARGVLRTWGRWNKVARPITGRDGFGCTEHPWVRLTVSTPDGPVSATVASVHVAPLGIALKNRAIDRLRHGMDAIRAAVPTDLAAVGGDLNLSRCLHHREQAGCHLHPGHRALLGAGWRDAVRDVLPSGPGGIAGVSRRIDFLYVRGRAADAWWDRCYQAYRVQQWPCGGRAVFADQRRFVRCQGRSLRQGRAGGGCPAASFRRYYSDHPLLIGELRPS